MQEPRIPARSLLEKIARRAMIERDLLPDFTAAALNELSVLSAAPIPSSVRDLRHLLWCSIDNDDSRDLDQLTVAQPNPGGGATVLVAIADVDEVVHRGSAIDAHARANTTSVYTAARVFPMLPERLSTDLTSLGENEERCAIVIELAVGADGVVSESAVYRAAVRNRAKLAYASVAAWLEGTGDIPAHVRSVPGMDVQLRLQDQLAQTMREVRRNHGALSLDTLETRPVFEGDTVADLRPDEDNRAKQLIEDFMVAANIAVARFLAAHRMTSIRRVLPLPERWNRIVELALGFGERLPERADGIALERFLTRCRETRPERYAEVSLAVVKLLGRGQYARCCSGAPSPGHFGLAVKDYTHATAPNRRFPDLVTQRMVKAALSGSPVPYADDELDEIARHCTEQEENAAKAERQVRKSAAALLLAPRVGQRFEAVVTGASSKGTWVRITHPTVEGKLVRGTAGLDVGDAVSVELVRTDPERGFIDFTRWGVQ